MSQTNGVRIDFITLFPETLNPFLGASMMGRAAKNGFAHFGTVNPRSFCTDKHQKVDDTPYGGHPGMLIKAEPVFQAVKSLGEDPPPRVVLTTPAARRYTQADATRLAGYGHLIFLCGHYEGFDHRLEEAVVTDSYSLGDFVMTNGELAALCMADSVVRLIPGVLGDQQSLEEDSYSNGILSAPNFTRPEVWRGLPVPPVLLSGNHEAIAKWRRKVSLETTKKLRSDLLAKTTLSKQDLKLIESLGLGEEQL